MSKDQFAAVTIDIHDKGRTKKKLNAALNKTAQALHDFCLENGYDLTKKASATVSLEVTFVHLESGMFAARAKIKEKVPSAPASATMLVVENGKVLAPTALELDDHDDPRQKILPYASKDAASPQRKEM